MKVASPANIWHSGIAINVNGTTSYLRHTSFLMNAQAFVASNIDFAWYFYRQQDGSFYIQNEYYGESTLGVDWNGRLRLTVPYDIRAVNWFLKPKTCITGQYLNLLETECVATCHSGSTLDSTGDKCVCPSNEFPNSQGTTCVTSCDFPDFWNPVKTFCQNFKSRDCDYVKGAYELMNGLNTVFANSSFNASYCCDTAKGITCSGSTVTEIIWNSKSLSSSLPLTISHLLDLTKLYFCLFLFEEQLV